MKKKLWAVAALLALLAFAIPIEYKYHKLFRFFSKTLIPQGLDISPNYDRFIYFYPSDLISILLLFIALFWMKIPKRFFGNSLWVVFICAIASIIASPFASYPIPYIRLLHLLTPVILFSFLAAMEEKERITRIILIAVVTAALFQTGVAILQYFHQAPLGLRLLGEPTQFPAFSGGGHQWIRPSGTLPHPNILGGFLLMSILATYAFIMQAKKYRWLLAAAFPPQLFAMSVTYSRSALFAWMLSTLVWLGMIGYQKGIKTVRYFALFIALSFVIITAALFNQYQHRGGIVNYNALAKASDSTRHFHHNIALKIMKDRPFLGLGFSQFSERVGPYLPEDTPAYERLTAPHNIFLFLACETGLISLGALLSVIALLLWKATQTPITTETATLTALLIGFCFIGCCDFYPILFQQGKLMFFLVAGLLAAHVQKREELKEAFN